MIQEKWDEIRPTLTKVLKAETFSLSLPAVVVKPDGAVLETNLSSLTHHLNASAALSSPQLTAFSEKAALSSYEEAFDELINGDDGEAFAEQWDEAQADLKNGSLCSISDVVRAIKTARDGFEEKPRRMLVVVMSEEGLEVLLVAGSRSA